MVPVANSLASPLFCSRTASLLDSLLVGAMRRRARSPLDSPSLCGPPCVQEAVRLQGNSQARQEVSPSCCWAGVCALAPRHIYQQVQPAAMRSGPKGCQGRPCHGSARCRLHNRHASHSADAGWRDLANACQHTLLLMNTAHRSGPPSVYLCTQCRVARPAAADCLFSPLPLSRGPSLQA